MAFDPSKFKSFKAPETRLYMASWGNDDLVTHDYGDEESPNIQPLVFQHSERKIGPNDHYAYHISPEGGKHGVERLVKPDGTQAKLWSAISMLKLFTNFFSKKYKAEEPTFSKGKMSNNQNTVYAHYTCGLTIGVQIMRPDANVPDYRQSPIAFLFRVDEEDEKRREHQAYTFFDFEEKHDFIKACRRILA